MRPQAPGSLAAAKAAGVTLRTGAEVTAIDVAEGAVTGVTLADGATIAAGGLSGVFALADGAAMPTTFFAQPALEPSNPGPAEYDPPLRCQTAASRSTRRRARRSSARSSPRSSAARCSTRRSR